MPKTLLLADDSVTIQKVVGITFANEDVELVTVDNGDDALVRARQIKPDLVLADIGMPGLDGYALCAAIRKDPTIAHTPVLLLTGTFETYDEDKAREVGASGYISKPFEAQALVDRVQAMLAQKVAPPAPRGVPPTRPITVPVSPRAPVAAPAHVAAERPKLELPPLPGASASTSGAKPRPSKPRVSSPFEFDVTPETAPAKPAPVASAAPLWEAEPELEAIDETPLRRSEFESKQRGSDDAPTGTAPDATRLFAPDLLGRAARLPKAPEPMTDTPPARPDFSFGDLDFEEPTGSPGNQTQIFGESSGPLSGAETVLSSAPSKPASTPSSSWDEREPNAPLADPLYSKTRFLDPHAAAQAAPSFDTPLPTTAPPLPDLLGSEEVTEPSHSLSEIELSDAESEPEIEAEPIDESDPFAEPFSPDTSAAFEDPEFAPVSRAKSAASPAFAATRLAFDDAVSEDSGDDLEAELLDAEALPEDAIGEPPAELDDWAAIREPAEPELRPTAPLPKHAQPSRSASSSSLPAERPHALTPTVIDSALLAQTLEKVAWEAFGSLSEQVVNEVKKRVEAVVWEVVPQMCERLIREEIARLKAELPE